MSTVLETNISLKPFARGKVRDIYDLDDKLLIVASDRISAFDYVLPTPIPDKGKVLTQISVFWFNFFKASVPNHLLTTDLKKDLGKILTQKDLEALEGRSMLVKKAKRINIECIIRGYISGSAWKEYKETGKVCEMNVGANLKESDKLSEPIFTPSIKSMSGHDINITEEQVVNNEGAEITKQMKEKSMLLYKKAAEYAEKLGIIIADTKFEFGTIDGKVILIDEALTPDSSRFWERSKYEPGKSQESYDKQYVRDYLESIKWNKQPPVPELPENIVAGTREKYLEAFRKITQKAQL
ncbi:MAG: phosphoribosylaminoimidazolesuccinocarboxamide synthase [Elusimicrobia bacterium RIFOXYA2_FULL_39_19]|nr:MAG: phosphoribosylaminoimidazolesuccinocarboxamide synthase [Elusimicrobia bacterium RIFOXYA2_FULL_39_19]